MTICTIGEDMQIENKKLENDILYWSGEAKRFEELKIVKEETSNKESLKMINYWKEKYNAAKYCLEYLKDLTDLKEFLREDNAELKEEISVLSDSIEYLKGQRDLYKQESADFSKAWKLCREKCNKKEPLEFNTKFLKGENNE